ncbi:hypothetical protein WJX82_004019 [Trebouxia sp. C0006]
MGFCCCFQQALLQTLTTTRENETFTANEQDTVTETGTQLTDNLKAGFSVAADPVCPAPTEHRLCWSPTPHPPSVASSTLFDPEGQAFAKHYNPLLSGETSHGSQHSSDKPSNAIAFRRFGEQMQADSQALPSSSMPGQSSQTALQASSQYAAPASQAMHTDNITSKARTEPLEEQRENQSVRVLPKAVAGAVPTAEAEAEGTHKQSSLGKQLGDALRLRNWKTLEAPAAVKEPDQEPSLTNQANPSQIPQPAQMTDAMVLSTRTESALLIAASELGFDAEQDNPDLQSESWRLTAAAQPFSDPASASRLEQEMQSSIAAVDGPMQSAASVTMLQRMTARAASFRPDSMREAYSPPSPLPSIDSSSSWTERSLPPKSKNASQQECTASGDKMVCYSEGSAVAEREVAGILDTASGIEQVAMPTEDKQKDAAVTGKAAQGAKDQGQHQAAAFQPSVESTSLQVSRPKQTLEEMAAWLDAQLAAVPGKTPGKAQSSSKAVMPVPASTQSACPAQAVSHPTGSPPAVPPIAPEHRKGSTQRQLLSAHALSKAASAPGVMGRTGSQTKSRPIGLPLARKGSITGKPVGKLPTGGQVKGPGGTQLSVTEMMQWLDSKLAQAVPKQAPVLPPPPIRQILPDEDSSAISGVSALAKQHQASEASSSQQAVSRTEAHNQVETCDTQPDAYSTSSLCDSVQAGVSKSQQAPQCGARGDIASSRQAASDDNCTSDTRAPPSSCDFTATETHSPAVAASGMESCAPAAAQELPGVTQGSATAKQAPAAAAPEVAGPSPLPPRRASAINGVAMPQEGSTPQTKAAQTAAEMLQWLDAALAGKKLPAVKAPTVGTAAEPKKSSSPSAPAVGLAMMKQGSGGNQAHSLKTAGTSDMLAWLDAKIAAQKASIVG